MKDIKNRNSKIVKRSYLARDFDSFKRELLNHARTFFPDQIDDFSESGLGGMFVDMLAYIGDSMSYYLDHQFNELDWRDAIEVSNIKKHIELSDIQVYGANPSTVYVNFYIALRYVMQGSKKVYVRDSMPIIKSSTQFLALNGITYLLTEDLDFSRKTIDNSQYLFENNTTQPGPPNQNFDYVHLSGLCVSGNIATETFNIRDEFIPFREIVLSEPHISLIEEIKDSEGNIYYEVDNLSQDNVYTLSENSKYSNNNSEKVISLLAAPYRFMRKMDPQTFLTKITFGGGDAVADDDDILPDPANLSLPLYGKKTFSKFSLDPNSLLKTHTLGVAPRNTVLSIRYRYGGGFDHNVGVDSINEISFLDIEFPANISNDDANLVRSSVSVLNKMKASGGAAPPTLVDLREQIPSARNSQKRIVTKEDLLSRIYSLPSPLGKIFRASMSEAPNSFGQIEIAIISRDFDGTLTNFGAMQVNNRDLKLASDNLKINLKNYLESFRMINDSYVLLDAVVHNFGLKIKVIATPGSEKALVAQSIISNIKKLLSIDKFNINQPLSMGDINYAILSSDGVSSLDTSGIKAVTVESLVGSRHDGSNTFDYSLSQTFDAQIIERGFIFPRKNGIFELKYPDFDIKVSVR